MRHVRPQPLSAARVQRVLTWQRFRLRSYFVSPRMAYNLMELVEEHAFETYDKFLQTDGESLKSLPPPEVALRYYNAPDPYMFDEFAIGVVPGERRPKIETLYDVFVAIRDDEAIHAHTMRLCQTAGSVRSPHDTAKGVELAQACEGVVECVVAAPTGLARNKPAAAAPPAPSVAAASAEVHQ